MVLLTNPIWLVKTRMQLQVKSSPSRGPALLYKSIPDAFATIVKEEGVQALYKGVAPALLLVSHGMIQFFIYEHLKMRFPANARKPTFGNNNDIYHGPMDRLKDSVGYLSMGAVSKVVASTATYPIQVIKSRMQQRSEGYEVVKGVDAAAGSSASDGANSVLRKFKNRSYPTLFSAARKIYEGEGTAGFFKGAGTNAFRVAPNAAVTFLVYEGVVDFLS